MHTYNYFIVGVGTISFTFLNYPVENSIYDGITYHVVVVVVVVVTHYLSHGLIEPV